jgi:IS5 family transposase
MIARFFETLLDKHNSSKDVWTDSAYRSEEKLRYLRRHGFREHIQRKGCRHKKLTEREKSGNYTRSKPRSRVEHDFGVQAQRAGTLLIRTIGKVRATTKIGLRNLAFNIDRYCMLAIA